MNIKDLPKDSYKVVSADKINIKDLPAGSYKQISGQPQQAPAPAKPFRFDVPPAVTLPSNKKAQQLKEEADKAKEESDKNSGFWNVTKNVVKGLPSATKKVGKFLTSSEQGLGESIAKGLDNTTVETSTANIEGLSKQNAMLLKTIKVNEAAGKDSSALKREFNKNADLIEKNGGTIQEFSDSLPTNKQVIGQAAGTALDILTAGSYGQAAKGAKSFQLLEKTLPTASKVATKVVPGVAKVTKVAEIASKPSGIMTVKGATNIAKGAGIGYGYDVSQNLQAGEEGGDIFKPGVGTVIGAALPAAAEVRQSFKNKAAGVVSEAKANKIIAKRENELSILESKYNGVRKAVDKAKSKGIEVKKILASTDLLNNAVDDTGHINTQNAMAELNDFIKPQESVISENLAIEGKKISLDKVRAKLTRAIDNSGLEMGSLTRSLKEVDDDLAGLARRADADGNIAIAKLHEAKVDKYSNINYMNPESKKAGKVIAKALKELVEENTDSVNVKELNRELAAHYSVLDLLEKLQGKKVEGGKLGKYFAQTVGAIAGSHFGPLGSIAGAEIAGRVKGSALSRKLNGKTGKVMEQSEAMKKALANIDGYRNSIANKAVDEATTSIPVSTLDSGTKATSLPKYKGNPENAIKVNYADNPNNPEFIPKAKIKAKVAELKSAKPSSYIKVNNFDTPEFPKYIPRDNKRIMTALESKKNSGKPIDVVKNVIKKKLVRMSDIQKPRTNIQYVPVVEKKIKVNLPKKKK